MTKEAQRPGELHLRCPASDNTALTRSKVATHVGGVAIDLLFCNTLTRPRLRDSLSGDLLAGALGLGCSSTTKTGCLPGAFAKGCSPVRGKNQFGRRT